jgi:hypothetical protein
MCRDLAFFGLGNNSVWGITCPFSARKMKSLEMKATGRADSLGCPGWGGTLLTLVRDPLDCAYSLTRLPVKMPSCCVSNMRANLLRYARESDADSWTTSREKALNMSYVYGSRFSLGCSHFRRSWMRALIYGTRVFPSPWRNMENGSGMTCRKKAKAALAWCAKVLALGRLPFLSCGVVAT